MREMFGIPYDLNLNILNRVSQILDPNKRLQRRNAIIENKRTVRNSSGQNHYEF